MPEETRLQKHSEKKRSRVVMLGNIAVRMFMREECKLDTRNRLLASVFVSDVT